MIEVVIAKDCITKPTKERGNIMRKILFLIVILGFTGLVFSQSHQTVTRLDTKFNDDNHQVQILALNTVAPSPIFAAFSPAPPFAVPGIEGFADYATNGNTTKQIIRNGDTILISMNYVDSIEAPNANGGQTCRMMYNLSTNGGTSWVSQTRLELSNVKSRWPDMVLYGSGATRTVGATGRVWVGTGASTYRAGGMAYDITLGVGSGTVVYVPGTGVVANTNNDVFCTSKPDGNVGCVMQSNDTIYYLNYNTTTQAFGPRIFIYRTANSNTVSAYTIASSKSGNHMTIAYCFVNESASQYGGEMPWSIIRYNTSTDNGATWSSTNKLLSTFQIEGDSVKSYWHIDVLYKPNTVTPYIVWSTVPPLQYGNWNPGGTLLDSNRKGYNVVIWSPAVHGGLPTRVASYRNVNTLADTNLFKQVTYIKTISGVTSFAYQVNSNLVSHPTIGFSDNGNTLYCAFSVPQPDSSSEGILFQDIYVTKSIDGGTTWMDPVNINNNGINGDEMYPVLSRYGNNSGAELTYQFTTVPGCQGFGRTGVIGGVESHIIAKAYQIYRTGIIGVNSISNKIPASFTLEQNYPNPFNPTTKIRFSISSTSNVTMKVYDIRGREVATIINNENLTPGTKEVEFNASKLASGVYFYMIKAGSFTDTKKMILVK